jgi:hypothetical protein
MILITYAILDLFIMIINKIPILNYIVLYIGLEGKSIYVS